MCCRCSNSGLELHAMENTANFLQQLVSFTVTFYRHNKYVILRLEEAGHTLGDLIAHQPAIWLTSIRLPEYRLMYGALSIRLPAISPSPGDGEIAERSQAIHQIAGDLEIAGRWDCQVCGLQQSFRAISGVRACAAYLFLFMCHSVRHQKCNVATRRSSELIGCIRRVTSFLIKDVEN